MRIFKAITKSLSFYMAVLAGAILVTMMALTFADVVGRAFGKPVKGTYDIMCMLGAVLAGFALPRASLQGAHVIVDLVTDRLHGKARKILKTITKLLGFFFFLLGALYLAFMGKNLILTNTVSMTLRFPFYPVAFGLAASCLIQCLVLIYQIFEEEGEGNE